MLCVQFKPTRATENSFITLGRPSIVMIYPAVGRNIYLKNNLKSLEFTRSKRGGKSKIDHDSSKAGVTFSTDENWETSPLGMYAKDVSDATVGVIELCRRFFKTSEEVWWDSPEELEANTARGRDLVREQLLDTLRTLGLRLN